MPPKIARLAGLGAYGATLGIAALFALACWICWPKATGGMRPELAFLALLGIGGVLLALIAVHVVFGHQLLLVSKGESRPV